MITLAKLKAVVIELKTLEAEAKNLKEKQEKAVLKFNEMLKELENGQTSDKGRTLENGKKETEYEISKK